MLRLEAWPNVSGAKALPGRLAGQWRLRTGDYRIQFNVAGDELIVTKSGTGIDFMKIDVPFSAGEPQVVTLGGERFVIVPESEYKRLQAAADAAEPSLPARDKKGNYPAAEALQVSIAKSIIRSRRLCGPTQAELARRAGIRPETLNRIEQGKHAPSVATLERLETALGENARRRTPTGGTRR